MSIFTRKKSRQDDGALEQLAANLDESEKLVTEAKQLVDELRARQPYHQALNPHGEDGGRT